MPNARRDQPRDERGIPHNLEAEKAVLGAAFLNAEAAATVPDPDHFFKPNHQHIAHAVRRLLNDGSDRPDVITVADVLRRDGLLDTVGGVEALLSLQNATPAISNAARYATIVTDTWKQRQVLWQASHIVEAVYENGDTGNAVGRVIDVLQALTTTTAATSTLDIADLAEVLAGGLEPVQPNMGERSDGAMLLYAGKIHSVVAESTSGKSWIALFWAVQIMMLGGTVVYFDYEDSARSITDRLIALGATPAQIVAQFRHVRPHAAIGAMEKVEIKRVLDQLNPDLIIIDALVGSLVMEGFAEDSNDDLEKWATKIPRWLIAESGAAVLILDHVVKDSEQRGRYARGASRKLDLLDGAQYGMKVTRQFKKTQAGSAILVCNKDRLGNYATGEVVASVSFDPAGNGAVLRIAMNPYTADQSAHDDWKPTTMMGKIARLLAESAVELTASAVKAAFPQSKTSVISAALTRLMHEGYVRESRGGRGRAKTLKLLRPYGDSGAPHADDAELFPDPSAIPVEPGWIGDEHRASFYNLDDYR